MLRILLGVDGSAGSMAALDHVLALVASGLQCQVQVVAVQEPVYLVEVLLPPDAEVLERWTAAAGRRAIDQACERLRGAGVVFESEVVTGDPAAALLEAAEDDPRRSAALPLFRHRPAASTVTLGRAS